MSNATHVKAVTLTVEMDNGDLYNLVVHDPQPGGSNPRFMAQQVANAVEELDRRADDLMEHYGPQIRKSA